jgi:Reverse transcriptase (RNA-dependent DNA polymerase)
MFFGLCNSPATFQRMMNDIFANLIAKGKVTVYLDDILIATPDLLMHIQTVREVLDIIQTHNLYLKPEKCDWI